MVITLFEDLDMDKEQRVIGRTFVVQQCEAREHGNNSGCVCELIGNIVKITKRYETPFTGITSFHISDSDKTVRLSELWL